jgi:precorrin-3B methylase
MAGKIVWNCAKPMIDAMHISLIDAAAQLGAATHGLFMALSLSLLLIPAGALRLRCP